MAWQWPGRLPSQASTAFSFSSITVKPALRIVRRSDADLLGGARRIGIAYHDGGGDVADRRRGREPSSCNASSASSDLLAASVSRSWAFALKDHLAQQRHDPFTLLEPFASQKRSTPSASGLPMEIQRVIQR